MRAIDLETRVLGAVERIRAGDNVENDLIECKRTWPSDSKARQLAGSLNRAAGDPVIYVVGIDEKDGSIHDTSDTDILDWWNQIAGQFDQIPPEMIRHIDVPISATESVVGIAFASDRAPYLVKTGSPNPTLEIPMREGTGTRTARRDEVMRILAPALRVPAITPLKTTFTSHYSPAIADPGYSSEESVSIFGALEFFVEHDGQELVTLPTHEMTGVIEIGDRSFALGVTPNDYHSDKQAIRKEFVHRRREAAVISGPGVVPLRIDVLGLVPQDRALIANTEAVSLKLRLGILHATRPLILDLTLPKSRTTLDHPYELNQWTFHRGEDGFHE